MTLERANIAKMQGYTPGEQPREGEVLKLNTNENPYPASPQVAAALAAIDVAQLRRYPSPTADTFRHCAAALHGVDADNIMATNGGDELLRLALTTFANCGDVLAIAEPGYSLYPVLAEIQDCKLHRIPLTSDWTLPPDCGRQLNASGAKIAMLVNPHAPSGQLTDAKTLATIATQFSGVLLVDEAYVDFVDPELKYDLTKMVNKLDNLLLLRTMSKGYSLAGLRFGYGIGSKSVISPMNKKTRDSYNTDYLSQKLATAALDSVDYARQTWQKVRQQRQRLITQLGEMGLPVLPSQTNFLLVSMADSVTAKAVYESLKQQKILVRHFEQARLDDKLRITIGSQEENDHLISCLKSMI